MRYTYKEFLNFCHQKNSKIRIEADIVWHGKIPLPDSLVKKIFFDAQNMLSIYLDHLISACAVKTYDLLNNTNFFSLVPAASLQTDRGDQVDHFLDAVRQNQKFIEIEDFIIQASGLQNYQKLTPTRFTATLRHAGKKYERIYVPKKIKNFISKTAPKLNESIGISNGDMFGNVIADELNIYRSGFSDAFAGIFKEYLEYKFEFFGNFDPALSALGVVSRIDYEEMGSVSISKNMVGNLWEPKLGSEGGIDTFINETHPMMLKENLSADERFNLLLLAMSHEEMHQMNDNNKELIEEFRMRVSNILKNFAAKND